LTERTPEAAVTIPDDMRAHNRALIAEFRETGSAPGGRPLLLLTTTGRRSGQPRTTPMMFIPDGDRLLVVASNAGARRHPDWYLNLVADPAVTVEVAGETYPAAAVPLPVGERDRVFAAISERFPFFTDHQAAIDRTIPVVGITRS
jgi:deazaflavin-dependent oxidoreductase (nitroreductase family)